MEAKAGVRYGFGGHSVTEIHNNYFNLPNGERLALKLWLPTTANNLSNFADFALTFPYDGTLVHQIYDGYSSATKCVDEKHAIILEYIPYGKDDWTFQRDRQNGIYFASHGFIYVRADIRGSGMSSGFYADEYLQQELNDCVLLIDWLAKRSASNERVGMYGKSWGGFNSLQVGYLRPSALKAIVDMYASDSRFTNDIYYMNGSRLAQGLPLWCSQMFAWNARPPTPGYYATREEWERAWRQRFDSDGAYPWTGIKVEHDTNDYYWQHGSVSTNYSNLDNIPTFNIGAWNDGYTISALKLAASLNPLTTCTMIGPWTHELPDCATPGPNINYRKEMLEFWDAHLQHPEQNEECKMSKMRMFVRRPTKCSKGIKTYEDGKWITWSGFGNDFNNWMTQPYNMEMHAKESRGIKLHLNSDEEAQQLRSPPPKDMDSGATWCAFDSGDLAGVHDVQSGLTFNLPITQNHTIGGAIRLCLVVDGKYEEHSSDKRCFGVRLICGTELISFGCPTLCNVEARKLDGVDSWKLIIIEMKPNSIEVKTTDSLNIVFNSHLFPMAYPSVDPNPVTMKAAISYLDYMVVPKIVEVIDMPKPMEVFGDLSGFENMRPVEEFDDQTTVSDLSSLATTSETHVKRSFKAEWGRVEIDIIATVMVKVTNAHDLPVFEVHDTLTVTVDGKEWHTYVKKCKVPRNN